MPAPETMASLVDELFPIVDKFLTANNEYALTVALISAKYSLTVFQD
jgi:hypothetical protein